MIDRDRDVVVVFKASVGAHPPSENSPRHHHITTPARCCIHVSAFALVVYWHDPNGTQIATYQAPGLHRVEVQSPIFMEPR